MPKNDTIDAPMTLSGLFPDESDDDESENDIDNQDDKDNNKTKKKKNGNDIIKLCYEIQEVTIVNCKYKIRQYDYHSHNANRVWPGTFLLAEYLLQKIPDTNNNIYRYHQWGNILELGTATGLLSILLCSVSRVHYNEDKSKESCHDDDGIRRQGDYNNGINKFRSSDYNNLIEVSSSSSSSSNCARLIDTHLYCCNMIITSDVQDEQNDIYNNIQYNYQLNHINNNPPLHIPHTWGTGWINSFELAIAKELSSEQQKKDDDNDNDNVPLKPSIISSLLLNIKFDTIIASDILLYVNSYDSLVQTLNEIFVYNSNPNIQFIMSWNRRMIDSQLFFEKMETAGFQYKHVGQCIYIFTKTQTK